MSYHGSRHAHEASPRVPNPNMVTTLMPHHGSRHAHEAAPRVPDLVHLVDARGRPPRGLRLGRRALPHAAARDVGAAAHPAGVVSCCTACACACAERQPILQVVHGHGHGHVYHRVALHAHAHVHVRSGSPSCRYIIVLHVLVLVLVHVHVHVVLLCCIVLYCIACTATNATRGIPTWS